MCGSRDAPAARQEEIEKPMVELGCKLGVSTPCLYYHPVLRIHVVAHMDDMLRIGEKSHLETFRKYLMKKYDLTRTYLGPQTYGGSCRGLRVSTDFLGEQRGELLGRTFFFGEWRIGVKRIRVSG